MLAWITDNLATVLICAVLLLIVAAIIRKLGKDTKKGNSPCGCGCAHCAMADACHSKK